MGTSAFGLSLVVIGLESCLHTNKGGHEFQDMVIGLPVEILRSLEVALNEVLEQLGES